MAFEKDDLNQLRELLRGVNVSDDHLRRGVTLTIAGQKKVAERFKIPVEQVPAMLKALSDLVFLQEEDQRFAYEKDYLGNVTIRDLKTGKDRFLQGDDGVKLDNLLSANPDKQQAIIAKQFGVTDLNEAATDSAIATDQGTFNFPYKGMFATASYGLDVGGQFVLNVESLRDSEGNEQPIDPSTKDSLHDIAMKWVDKV